MGASALVATPAHAYEIVLDIDLDDDPATINETTSDESAVVRIVLKPEAPDEQIESVYFELGGSCIDCPPDDLGAHCRHHQ